MHVGDPLPKNMTIYIPPPPPLSPNRSLSVIQLHILLLSRMLSFSVKKLLSLLYILLFSVADNTRTAPASPSWSTFSLDDNGSSTISGDPISAAAAAVAGLTTTDDGASPNNNNNNDQWVQPSADPMISHDGKSLETVALERDDNGAATGCPYDSSSIPTPEQDNFQPNRWRRLRRGGICAAPKDPNPQQNSDGQADAQNGVAGGAGAGKPSLADLDQLPVVLPPPRQKIESDPKVCNHDFINIPVCAILLDPRTGAKLFPATGFFILPDCRLCT